MNDIRVVKRTWYWRVLLTCTLALLVLVAGCKRTAELTVRVMDVDGNAIPGAMVGLTELGETLLADEKGQVTWGELEGEEASLVVTAPEFKLRSKDVVLEPGPNYTAIVLDRREVPIQFTDS